MQVEALAALVAWAGRYDAGEWDDPPGKLALLYDLERVATLLRDGTEPFFTPAATAPPSRACSSTPAANHHPAASR